MKNIMITACFSLLLLGCQIPSGNSAASEPIASFFDEAEFILVCKKEGMSLRVKEVILGKPVGPLVGDVVATYERSNIPKLDIKPEASWTNLVVMLPRQDTIAYYGINESQNIKLHWYTDIDHRKETVSLDDLRKYKNQAE